MLPPSNIDGVKMGTPPDRADMTEEKSANIDRRFSDLVHAVREMAQVRTLSLQFLLDIVGPKGHAFLCMFLCLPFMQPIPLPGLSTPFGISMAIVGVLLFRGRAPWVPKRFGKLTLESSIVLKICSGLERLLGRLEHLVKPRGQFICRQIWIRRLNGGLFFVLGILLSLPLPIPFSNNVPAIAIFLISWGMLEEDLVVIGLGYLATLVAFGFFTALVVIPYIASTKFLGP